MRALTSVATEEPVSSGHLPPVVRTAPTSDAAALLVVEVTAGTPQVSWANQGAVALLGQSPGDLSHLTLGHVFPSLGAGQTHALLRPGRATQMTLPVRMANGGQFEALVVSTPDPGGTRWTLRVIATTEELERALRATAEAHERRFATLTERSPVPMLLSDQGMRLAHVNDAFCSLVGLPADRLLGTGWMAAVHPDDLDDVVEQVVAVLEGGEAETQVRLVRPDGGERTTVLRLSHLFTRGVGAGFVGTIEDVTDRLAFEARLAYQAHHDPLTGLPNRALLAEYVAERFRPGGNLACLFLDLDDFKLVNDSLGHAAGDELLVELASRLRLAVRPGDLVVRFGGDEFVVVCERVDEADAVELARRIVATLSPPVHLAGVEVRPNASVGVTVQTAAHAGPEELIRDCDIAMYQAKAAGKGRVAVLDERGRAKARDRLQLVADLRDAIHHGEITVQFQPILRADDGTPVGVESLARWEHPRRGAISPATFVPLAEENGLIGALGLLVLDRTCAQLSAWDGMLGRRAPRRANVNVSALQLDGNLCAKVDEALRVHGLAPSRLSIEITESALMTDPDAARDILQQLRDLGVDIAIDDFGTGYSSLAYLRHLPVDCLKVDRSFVAELSEGHGEIASAVIALAKTLGLRTVAEGVETPAQAEELAALGATHLQGFGLSEPMSGTDAAAWFAARRAGTP